MAVIKELLKIIVCAGIGGLVVAGVMWLFVWRKW